MTPPATMKALVLTQDGYARAPSGSTLEAMEPYVTPAGLPVPAPGPAQVLIKVSLAAINPSDVMFIKGLYGQPRRKGQPPGFEGVGVVAATGGETVAAALAGKRVAFATGTTGWGSWAGYAVAEAAACYPLPGAMRDEDGAAMIVNPLTALAMFGIVREEGEKSFILTAGASQLSKLMIGIARDEGFRAIAVVRRDDQIPLLTGMGATHVVNAEAPGFPQRMAELCRAERPRILLDAVTGPQAAAIFNAMGRGARWIVYGRMDASATTIPEPGQLIFMGKRVEGFWLTDWLRKASPETRKATVDEAQARFLDGRWRTDVTAVVPLDEAMRRVPEELAKPNGKVFIAP